MAKKILVVEDDKFLANAYRVKLSKEGFEIKISLEGEEALRSLDEFQPDLIILDLMMPQMDGFEFLTKIKSLQRWNKIPIIIASNLGQKEDIDRGLSLGANDYIVKSDLSMDQLIKKVYSLL